MFQVEVPISTELFENLQNDFELLKEMFKDDIILYNNNKENNLEEDTAANNDNNNQLLFLVKQFFYDEKNEKLIINFFIYWIQNKQSIIDNIKSKFDSIEEPYLFNSIDYTKELLTDSIEKEELLNLLSEIRFNKIPTTSTNPIHVLMELMTFLFQLANSVMCNFL